MNKFQNIINNVIEELTSTSVSVNPIQVASDLKKAMSSATPTTKKAIEAVTEPLANASEGNPDDETLERLQKLNFEKLPSDKKEQIMKTLMSWGIPLKTSEESEAEKQVNKTQTTSNPTSYGV